MRELGLVGEPDEVIIEFAARHGWVIITGDIEFGKFFYELLGKTSIIVLRSPFQNLPATLKIIQALDHNDLLRQISPKHQLVLASQGSIRVRTYEN